MRAVAVTRLHLPLTSGLPAVACVELAMTDKLPLAQRKKNNQ